MRPIEHEPLCPAGEGEQVVSGTKEEKIGMGDAPVQNCEGHVKTSVLQLSPKSLGTLRRASGSPKGSPRLRSVYRPLPILLKRQPIIPAGVFLGLGCRSHTTWGLNRICSTHKCWFLPTSTPCTLTQCGVARLKS